MKKILILLVIVAFTTSSCEDFLNTEPVDKISVEQYYNDEAGLTSALVGVYDQIGSVHNNPWFNFTTASDESFYNVSTATTGIQVNNFNATDGGVQGFWAACYVGIERANLLIASINVAQMDEAKRQNILGEALFLRGYYYFMLVSNFGDVPLRLEPTTSPSNLDMARTPSAEVYAQIEKDMKEAEAKVQTAKFNYCSRVSKTTVQGILARVYLYWAGFPLNNTAKYADALAYAKKVIDSGERGLNVSFSTDPAFETTYTNPPAAGQPIPAPIPNNAYRQIFINEAQNLYDTREVLWEVDFKGNQTDGYSERGPLGAQFGSPGGFNGNIYGASFVRIMGIPRLYNKYQNDAAGIDLRREWVMNTYNVAFNTTTNPGAMSRIPYDISTPAKVAANTFRSAGKWRREYEAVSPKANNDSGINYAVLRYADVLLMYAEAENQLNGPTAAAIEAVNQVRRRGYGQTNVTVPYAPSDAATAIAAAGGKDAFLKFIQDERSRELCFEGFRRCDLIRWNIYLDMMKTVGAEISGQTVNAGLQYGGRAGNNTTARNLLLPIPALEMLANRSITTNNPGW